MTVTNLRIVSYNCRSIKSNIDAIKELCTNHDIILIQEHWLLDHELPLLSNINCDFLSVGVSGVDVGWSTLRWGSRSVENQSR